MKRRNFLWLISTIAAQPLAARAQGTSKVPLIGVLDFFPSAISSEFLRPFQQGLRELGHLDGHNIRVEYQSAEQESERVAELAAEFVRRQFDVIVALATPAAHAAKNATNSIPM